MEEVIFENGVVVIDGKSYNLYKRGRDQAAQVVDLGRWINQYGIPAAMSLADEKGAIAFTDGIDLLGKVLNAVSVDALLSLFSTIVGCSDKVSEKYFDIGTLIDSVAYVYENQPALRKVIKRFFSGESSEGSTASE